MIVNLPQPIANYFAAANSDDADRIAACFAEDAVVRDKDKTFVDEQPSGPGRRRCVVNTTSMPRSWRSRRRPTGPSSPLI